MEEEGLRGRKKEGKTDLNERRSSELEVAGVGLGSTDTSEESLSSSYSLIGSIKGQLTLILSRTRREGGGEIGGRTDQEDRTSKLLSEA